MGTQTPLRSLRRNVTKLLRPFILLKGFILFAFITSCGRGVKLAQATGGSDDVRPYTLHATPNTLHPTQYTLHPTPYTLHPTPYTLHPQPSTLHPQP